MLAKTQTVPAPTEGALARMRAVPAGSAPRVLCSLAAVIALLLSPKATAQDQISNQPARYHLLQLVDPTTFLEKVNDTTTQGYRLVALSDPPGSLAAIMEHVENSPAHHNYLSIPVRGTKSKYETTTRVKEEVAEQLNADGAKGYRLRMVLPGLIVMESSGDTQQRYEYALSAPSMLGYFKTDEISGLLAAGYHWAASVTTILIFERPVGSNNATAGSTDPLREPPDRRFTFPENNFVRSNLPEKQLRKLAAEGARVVDFFGSPMQMILAMEEAVSPGAPYQYVVLEPKNQASPLALHAKMSRVDADDLTRVGRQGFRFLQLSAPAPPFVMEKASGSTMRYEYQLITTSNLSELAARLNGPGLNEFNVVKMVGNEEGFLVVLERSDAN